MKRLVSPSRRLRRSPRATAREPRRGVLMSHARRRPQSKRSIRERPAESGNSRSVRSCSAASPARSPNSAGSSLRQLGPIAKGAPGRALYGGNPDAGRSHPMKPVVELPGPESSSAPCRERRDVGYSATWTASADSASRDRRAVRRRHLCAPQQRLATPRRRREVLVARQARSHHRHAFSWIWHGGGCHRRAAARARE